MGFLKSLGKKWAKNHGCIWIPNLLVQTASKSVQQLRRKVAKTPNYNKCGVSFFKHQFGIQKRCSSTLVKISQDFSFSQRLEEQYTLIAMKARLLWRALHLILINSSPLIFCPPKNMVHLSQILTIICIIREAKRIKEQYKLYVLVERPKE